MNEKQQQLLFDKGITNVPSDLLCSDNTLEESVGMIYDDGEHRVIQNPVTKISQQYWEMKILYVHKYNDGERYVGVYDNKMCFGTLANNQTLIGPTYLFNEKTASTKLAYEAGMTVTSVGKTLIVRGSDGFHYYNWKENYNIDGDSYANFYEFIADTIPEQNFEFWLKAGDYVYNSGSAVGMMFVNGTENPIPFEAVSSKKGDAADLIAGLYYKNLKAISQKNAFCQPFYVRTALQLYDGTYTHISQPILLFPCITENSAALLFLGDLNSEENSLYIFTEFNELYFSQSADLKEWGDIVKNLSIFISDGIEVHDLSIDQTASKDLEINAIYQSGSLSTYIHKTWDNSRMGRHMQALIDFDAEHKTNAGFAMNPKSKDAILNQIKGTSIFYKICEVGLNPVSNKPISEYMEAHTLENLTTQEYIDEDDYFSHSKMYPKFTYTYNSRLNLANVSRGVFEGYGFFMPYDNLSPSTYDIRVRLNLDVNNVMVKHIVSTNQKQGIYFYYPDSRAKHVTIFKGTTCILDEELTEHPSLNGAYFFKGLPGVDENEPTSATPEKPYNTTITNNHRELLPNYIITSEVNNPWVYKAEGYNKVGTGRIIGMSTITQALSQGQFGQYPLLVFSTDGIWAMSVNNTGLFQTIHPMSREVCNNAGSITQTDGAVFFSSEKGLMVVVGGDVKCVSEQLSGRESSFIGEIEMGNFRDYLANCFIAYDYRDSLLWIFNNSRTHVVDGSTVPYNTEYCYVYSIKSGTFGKYHFASAITNVVNDYPDYLLQAGSTVFSLTGRQNVNLDNTTYTGLMITRPMKLENGLALKSLMQVRNLRQFSTGATLQLTIYGSNNCENWVSLPSLRGTPWKYFRFKFDLAGMKATDRFAGSVIVTQERRTDKLR